MITAYNAKYYGHQLTCQHTADSVERLLQSLFDAIADLKRHQIEAARFALQNPLQQGVLVADDGVVSYLAKMFHRIGRNV